MMKIIKVMRVNFKFNTYNGSMCFATCKVLFYLYSNNKEIIYFKM